MLVWNSIVAIISAGNLNHSWDVRCYLLTEPHCTHKGPTVSCAVRNHYIGTFLYPPCLHHWVAPWYQYHEMRTWVLHRRRALLVGWVGIKIHHIFLSRSCRRPLKDSLSSLLIHVYRTAKFWAWDLHAQIAHVNQFEHSILIVQSARRPFKGQPIGEPAWFRAAKRSPFLFCFCYH
jgi:hypothetical protein